MILKGRTCDDTSRGNFFPKIIVLMYRPTIRMCGVLGIFALFLLATNAQSDNTCTKAEIKQARRETSHLQDWSSIYTSYQHFGRCDDRDVGEQFSYAIGHVLADDWQHVDSLLQLAAEDLHFQKFVLKHINEDIPEEDAQLMIRNARQNCPPHGEWLCKAIVDY